MKGKVHHMYMGPNSVGGKMNRLKLDIAKALASEDYSSEERKLLQDAIDSIEYVKGFFAGTSVLPKLTEDAETTWGKTWDWLRGAFKKIDMAEQLINQPASELQLEIGGNNGAKNGHVESTPEKSAKSFFDMDVPVFKPDPKVRKIAEEMLKKEKQQMDVDTASDEADNDNTEEDALYASLEYGLGM